MVVNYFVKQKIYETGGLADDVFMLGVTNSFISPALKIVDPGYIISRLKKWHFCKASNLINILDPKLKSNQTLLNDTCEFIIF